MRFFFFFQAEDGIRDFHVTGVQTCALPILALSLKLKMPVVRELLSREEIQVPEAPADRPAMAIGEAPPEFLDACCRLMDLLNTPRDIPFLSGLIQREIIYRILQSAAGARLRSIATLGD